MGRQEVDAQGGQRRGEVTFRFRYATDGGFNERRRVHRQHLDQGRQEHPRHRRRRGWHVGWTAKGWKASTGTEVTNAERYYLIENRQYVGYDHTLKVGPYQFSEAYTGSRLGRALPVPGRHARLARRPGLRRQQHHRPPGCGLRPAGRRPSGHADLPRRRRARRTGASRSTRSSARTRSTRSACTSRWRSRPRARRPSRPWRRATRRRPGRQADLRRHQACPSTTWPPTPLNSVKVAGEGVKATVVSEAERDLTVHVSQPGK